MGLQTSVRPKEALGSSPPRRKEPGLKKKKGPHERFWVSDSSVGNASCAQEKA